MKTNRDYQEDLKRALIELDEPIKKDKENDFLNVILSILIVLIVIVGIAGVVLIGKTYVKTEPNDPVVNQDPIVDDQDKPDDSNQVNDVVDSEDEFKVIVFKISKEESNVRFDIQSKTSVAGNVYLKADNLNIGPIQLDVGNNEIYFLVNGNSDYTLLFESNNGKEYKFEVSKEEINNALK